MDASAYRQIGEVLTKGFNAMLWWAMFGIIVAVIGGSGLAAFIIWWLFHHVTVHL